MREKGFRGNCNFPGKLGMCPSLAEPDSIGFPRTDFLIVSCEILLFGKTIFSVRQKSLRSFAFVLFAGGCVVRMGFASFLDCSLQEFFMFLEWRTAICCS